MKKNITINLCGRLYQIDEDAYELLSHYTDTLRDYFTKQEGGEEIADDIEARIAELFDELRAQGIEAITIEHVQGVIEQIGQVEDIAGEEAAQAADATQEKGNQQASVQEKKNGKKFFRDSQNKMLAGVLAGCAHYFGSSISVWRWGFVIALLLWIIVPGLIVTAFLGLFSSFAVLFFLVPLDVLPLIIYLLVAIFTPETKTPEDVLRMKGLEVNQQNLTMEVQEGMAMKKKKEGKSTLWDIFIGVNCVGLSTALTIGLIVALCFFVAFVAASDMMADSWWNIDKTEDINAIFYPVILSGIMLLASIAILLYCSIHAAVSSFGQTPSMSTGQRVMWFVLWVASLIGFIGFAIHGAGRLQKTQSSRWDMEHAEWVKTHTHDGFVFNDDDWNFFQKDGWKLVKAENTDRYTYSGEYMTGNTNVRYLDACNNNNPVLLVTEKSEKVVPGIYRLSAAVRADHDGCFIYVNGQDAVGDSLYYNGLPANMREIPNYGNAIGNIWEILGMEAGFYQSDDPNYLNDPVLKELVSRIPESDRKKIIDANNQRGYGWSYVYIDNIIVKEPTTLTYGVKIDDEENTSSTGWFSATDFKLERIGDK